MRIIPVLLILTSLAGCKPEAAAPPAASEAASEDAKPGQAERTDRR